MQNNIWYIMLFLFSVFISSVSQIILKKSTQIVYESRIKEYLNPKVVLAYSIFLIATLGTMWAYKVIPLSLGPVLEATGYIWVTILGIILLREKVSKKKWVGLGLLLLGIIIYNL